jgi:biofilm PGA synthesis lipoprotein PgaB
MEAQRHTEGDLLMSPARYARLPVWPLIAFVLMRACAVCAAAEATLPVKLTILGYHEISERTDSLEPGYSVPPEEFAQEMAWLKRSGYHFVGMDDVLADARGRKALPDRAVLITFDDGYQSVYSKAFPILQAYHAPAVVALVGSWLENAHGIVDFDGRPIPRSDLMSWAELREMVRSGLIEIASHTHSLHQGIVGNPEGNLQPAAVTRQWLGAQGRYEDEAAYKRRITADLKRNSDFIQAHLGKRPRIIVWPYGRYNIETRSIAARLGMPIGLTLDDGPDTAQTPLYGLRRMLVQPGMAAGRLDRAIQLRNHNVPEDGMPGKVMHIDLDYVYDTDQKQQEENLGRLLERIVAMGVNTVYLQAFADPDNDGTATAVYFPNRHMPVRADLFNRVAWQVLTRTGVARVYAWMPMLAWQLPASNPAAHDVVVTEPNIADHVSVEYPRLSPFSPRARKVIREIYQDLGRSSTIDGVLFKDDAALTEYEDGSRWALKAYRKWGLPQSLAELRSHDELLRRWTVRKTEYLDAFAGELAGVLREEEPGLKTARTLYASVVRNPHYEAWYSQSLDSSLAHFDYTAIMAMPYLEQAADPTAFLHELVNRVAERPGAMAKVVFELQSVNWRKDDEPIPGTELADTIRTLYSWGVQNVGYYPDDLFVNNPDPALLRPVFHLKPNAPPLSEILRQAPQ